MENVSRDLFSSSAFMFVLSIIAVLVSSTLSFVLMVAACTLLILSVFVRMYELILENKDKV